MEPASAASALEVDDIVVLLLGAPGGSSGSAGRIEGVTRLEKLVFLLQRETDLKELISEDPEFKAYNFGPYSVKVYEAIDTLVLAGLAEDSSTFAGTPDDLWESEEVIGVEPPDPYATRNVSLTETGRRYYDALIRDLPPGTEESVGRFKEQFAAIPLRQLVRYVYERYPDFTHRSIIRDEILGR